MTVNAQSNFSVKRNGTDRLAIESDYTTIKSVTATRIETNISGISKTYNFGETGILGLPYSSYLESTPARNLNLGAWSNVSIIANAETNSTTSWTFGADGTTAFPNYVFQAGDGDPGQVLTTNGSGSVSWTTPLGPTGNANTGNFTFVDDTLAVSDNGNIILRTNANDWNFGANGILTVPGGIDFTSSTAAITNVDVITVLDHIQSPEYQFSNGVNILSTISASSTYSNTNVAAYIDNGFSINNGAINFTSSPPAYSSPGIQWPGGIYQSEYYGNTQVGAYLTTYGSNIALGNASVTGKLTVNGNIAMTSNVARNVYVNSYAPAPTQGNIGDIWYQTF
jgi:hypothetical protein